MQEELVGNGDLDNKKLAKAIVAVNQKLWRTGTTYIPLIKAGEPVFLREGQELTFKGLVD